MPNALVDILNGDYLLNVNGVSKHLSTDVKYNERNPGLGITAERDGKFLTIGGYENSFGKPSWYAGGGLKTKFGNDIVSIEPGIIGGVVTGYDEKLTPMLMPMLSLGIIDSIRLNMMYAPKVKGQNPATLMFNTSIPFK